MFNLFLNPNGQLRRQDFLIAICCFAMFIFMYNFMMGKLPPTMLKFWLGFLFVPFIYSAYQVCKKRLRDMGLSARPFWIFIFLMIFLWVGLAIYFGWGEYFNIMFENEAKHTDEAWIKSQEKVLQDSLARGKPIAEKILLVPAALFTLWLAVTPGKTETA